MIGLIDAKNRGQRVGNGTTFEEGEIPSSIGPLRNALPVLRTTTLSSIIAQVEKRMGVGGGSGGCQGQGTKRPTYSRVSRACDWPTGGLALRSVAPALRLLFQLGSWNTGRGLSLVPRSQP